MLVPVAAVFGIPLDVVAAVVVFGTQFAVVFGIKPFIFTPRHVFRIQFAVVFVDQNMLVAVSDTQSPAGGVAQHERSVSSETQLIADVVFLSELTPVHNGISSVLQANAALQHIFVVRPIYCAAQFTRQQRFGQQHT